MYKKPRMHPREHEREPRVLHGELGTRPRPKPNHLVPTVSEIGLISLNRPFLSLLLTLGTVGVYPSRILWYEDFGTKTTRPLTSPESRPYFRSGCFGGYVLAAGLPQLWFVQQYFIVNIAVFNVCYTSWQLGVATVLNFICQSSYMPILWTVLPFFMHLPAALALRASIPSKSIRSDLSLNSS